MVLLWHKINAPSSRQDEGGSWCHLLLPDRIRPLWGDNGCRRHPYGVGDALADASRLFGTGVDRAVWPAGSHHPPALCQVEQPVSPGKDYPYYTESAGCVKTAILYGLGFPLFHCRVDDLLYIRVRNGIDTLVLMMVDPHSNRVVRRFDQL